jgi:DNA modification methylase
MQVNKIYTGDCKEVLKTFPDNYFDSCVTDPPYGISFMNKHWDYDVPAIELWNEVFRILKPGGHILSAGGTRTYHRMTSAIEDAGFEIRDTITWIYGSGFPKSLSVDKAIDKQAGAEREVIRENNNYRPVSGKIGYLGESNFRQTNGMANITTPSTPAAKQWNGWGTALKPATEMFCLARKPLSESTVAANVLKHGTGGLNIDGCRIEGEPMGIKQRKAGSEFGQNSNWNNHNNIDTTYNGDNGRFPANLILDEFAAGELDKQSGITESNYSDYNFEPSINQNNSVKFQQTNIKSGIHFADTGGASRFFYCAKADQFERNKGLNRFQLKQVNKMGSFGNQEEFNCPDGANRKGDKGSALMRNHHPTVKPLDLMQYLVRLITPKHGIVLDPFAGSGTTCIAAKLELINYIGIEIDPEYAAIAEARINAWNPEKYIEQKLFNEPAEKNSQPYLQQQLLF